MFSERLRNLWNSQNSSRPIGDGLAPRDWFTIENRADSADVYVFDAIMDFGITAGEFQAQLNAIKSPRINLFINSPGGFVHDGVAIYNALKQHPAKVHAQVQGIAASIASVILMAGDTIEMSPGSMVMIHEAFAMTLGSAADHRKSADVLDTMSGSIAGIYATRTGKDSAHWRGLMSEESWFTDREAVVAGLADSIVGEAKNLQPLTPVNQVIQPDSGAAARRLVALAQLEVIHAYA